MVRLLKTVSYGKQAMRLHNHKIKLSWNNISLKRHRRRFCLQLFIAIGIYAKKRHRRVGDDVVWDCANRVLFGNVEDDDAVPVVGLVGLNIAALSVCSEVACVDTIFFYEHVVDSLGTTFRESHVE